MWHAIQVRLVLLFSIVLLWTQPPFARAADDLTNVSGNSSVTIRSPRIVRRDVPRSSTLRLDVKLTLIPVTVTDGLDRPLLGLQKEDFHLFEDNVEQEIRSFSSEEGPVSIGIVFDTSGSMKNKLDKSIAAVNQLLKTTLPGDEFLLVSFADVPKLTTNLTTDINQVDRDLSLTEPRGWTALHDAMYLATQHMRTARNGRKALVVLTDGVDNNSRYTEAEVRNLVVESDVRIYAIGISERSKFLGRISEETGGRAFWVHKVDELPDVIDRLSTEFRSHYLLGYSSKNAQNDGKYRKVKVALQPRPEWAGQMRVFWRRGYYTPG